MANTVYTSSRPLPTSIGQDRRFECRFPGVRLADVLRWIAAELAPEHVFEDGCLREWADANGLKPDKDDDEPYSPPPRPRPAVTATGTITAAPAKATGRKKLAHVIRALGGKLDDGRIDTEGLRDAATLLRVLASGIEGKDLLKAMGAPGDFGYDTPLGDALLAALREG